MWVGAAEGLFEGSGGKEEAGGLARKGSRGEKWGGGFGFGVDGGRDTVLKA